MSPEEQSKRGVLYALFAYSFWGLIPAYYKNFEHISPNEMTAHRALWSAALGLGMLAVLGRLPGFIKIYGQPKLLGLLLLSGVCISSNWLMFLWAVDNDRMVEASMGYFINPLFSVMLGVVLLGERLRKGQIVSIVLAAMGVAYIVVSYGNVPWIAILLPFTFGMYGFIRKHTPVDSIGGLTAETSFMLPFAIGYVAWLTVRDASHFGTASLGDTAFLVSVGPITLLPLTLFAAAARRVRLATLGLLQYLSPSLTFLLAVLVYREHFDRVKLVAFLFIWASLLIYTLEGVRFSRLGAPRAQASPIPE